MTVSTTVPGGGLTNSPLPCANIRLLILFFTTITVNLGLGGREEEKRNNDNFADELGFGLLILRL